MRVALFIVALCACMGCSAIKNYLNTPPRSVVIHTDTATVIQHAFVGGGSKQERQHVLVHLSKNEKGLSKDGKVYVHNFPWGFQKGMKFVIRYYLIYPSYYCDNSMKPIPEVIAETVYIPFNCKMTY